MLNSSDYKLFFCEAKEDNIEFYGNKGAGALIIAADTGKLLLLLRSNTVNEPGTWNLAGGKINKDENSKETVEREIFEETGYDGDYEISPLHTFKNKEFRYYNNLLIVPSEFTPKLNNEHTKYKWIEYGEWPNPLHFGIKSLIKHDGKKIKKSIDSMKKKQDTILEAMDIPPSPPAIIQRVDIPKRMSNVDYKILSDTYILAATLWGEAREEGEVGMQSVMNVIMNRAKGDFNKAKDISIQPLQFSIWNGVKNPTTSAFNLAKIQRTENGIDKPMYKLAIEIVKLAMKGQLPDITGGATFYINPKKLNKKPDWIKKVVKTKSIGKFTFYKEKEKKIKEDYAIFRSN